MEIRRNCITIAAHADTVFAFVADPSTAALRMPPHLRDQYQAHEALVEGDVRETTYDFFGLHWTERRWVAKLDAERRRVIWNSSSRFAFREAWRVDQLDTGRCRLVLERQLASMSLFESLAFNTVIGPLLNLAYNRRLRMTRKALEGGWTRHSLRTA